MKWDWIFNLIAPIFAAIINVVSPQLRDLLTKFVHDLEKAAEKTPNTFDDQLVEMLKKVLGVD